MSKKSERVKRWRVNTKNRIIEAMGGSCCVCGYSKCRRSMDLHHLVPGDKEMGIGTIMAHPISWDRIVVEIRKCVLLCANCHGEVHEGTTLIPKRVKRFNEAYANMPSKKKDYTPCAVCEKMKPSYNITCSRICAAKRARKVDWGNIDLIVLREQGLSYAQIGNMLGVSDAAVGKRLKKIKIINGQGVMD